MTLLVLSLFCISLFGQEEMLKYSHFLAPEIMLGTTISPSEKFPTIKKGRAIFLHFGKFNYNNKNEWAYRLNYPKTGFSIGVTDFGNYNLLGLSYSVMPFIEFNVFKSRTLKANIGMGGSYFTKKYHTIYNPYNNAITTDLTWSFKLFLYNSIIKNKSLSWDLGAGYIHHSNGHTKLPNQGLNSLLISTSLQIFYNENINLTESKIEDKTKFEKSKLTYLSIRAGIGQNVLSEVFNEHKEIYSISISFGKTFNNTFKLGGGLFYRFYEHYYDYIKENGDIVAELYPYFLEDPYTYSTNFGFFCEGEVLLNHFSISGQLGFNVFKPFYKVDRILSQSYYHIRPEPGIPVEIIPVGKLDKEYELKRSISSRLGIRYYIIGTNNSPRNNFFISGTINSNFGQADFTEFSLGYVYTISRKSEVN